MATGFVSNYNYNTSEYELTHTSAHNSTSSSLAVCTTLAIRS